MNNSPFCSFCCSEESTKASGFHEAKRPRKEPSQKAKNYKRKREIEKIFSQQEISETGAKLPHTSSETDSDIEFEVGGSIKSTRYKLVYMFVYYISGRNVHSLIFLSIISVKLSVPSRGGGTISKGNFVWRFKGYPGEIFWYKTSSCCMRTSWSAVAKAQIPSLPALSVQF